MEYTTYKILGTLTFVESLEEAEELYRQGCEIAVLTSSDGVKWRQTALWVH